MSESRYGDVISIVRKLERVGARARYTWEQYRKAYEADDGVACKRLRETVMWHEAEVAAYMEALHVLTRDASEVHMYYIDKRLDR